MSGTAVYPGSFNPWHEGHLDIYRKALEIFDEVVIAKGINPEKKLPLDKIIEEAMDNRIPFKYISFNGLLIDFIERYNRKYPEREISAVVRGLRNGHDLQYEMNQQYWNEDLGLEVPIVHFICDRKLTHISSSAIRMVEGVTKR